MLEAGLASGSAEGDGTGPLRGDVFPFRSALIAATLSFILLLRSACSPPTAVFLGLGLLIASGTGVLSSSCPASGCSTHMYQLCSSASTIQDLVVVPDQPILLIGQISLTHR